MPQTVEIPDHGIAEFPDDMTPDQIKGVIQQKFYSTPPPSQSSEVPQVTPTEATTTQKIISGVNEVANVVQKGQQIALNPVGMLTEKLVPEGVNKFMRTGLVSPETIKPITEASMLPIRGLSTLIFGKEAVQEPLQTSEKAISEFASQQTSPEAVAIALGTAGIGMADSLAARRIAPKSQPTLSETLGFVEKQPEVLQEANAALSDLESKYAPPTKGVQNASEITSPTSVTQPEIRTPVGEETPLRQQGETPEARQGIEAQPQTQEAVKQPKSPEVQSLLDKAVAAGRNKNYELMNQFANAARELEKQQSPQEVAQPVPQPEQPVRRFADLSPSEQLDRKITNAEEMVSMLKDSSKWETHPATGSEVSAEDRAVSQKLLDGWKKGLEELKAQKESAAVPEAEAATTAEPWQMTKDDFHDEHLDDVIARRKYPHWSEEKKSKFGIPADPDIAHREAVVAAIREGKPVPPEVLADYPDIKPSPVSLPSETTTAATLPKTETVTPPTEPPAPIAVAPENPQSITSIKNEQVDTERAARNLPPVVEPARKAFGETWDQATKKIDEDPAYPDRLISELKAKPRALTDVEDAALLHRQVDLQNQFQKSADALFKARESGDSVAVMEHDARVNALSDQLLELYDVGKKAGTETGRGLAARKLLAAEDFSLANMVTQKRAANPNIDLETATKSAQLASSKISAAQAAYDAYETSPKAEAYRKRLKSLTEQYQQRTAKGDFETRKPSKILLDKEGEQLKANLERAKKEWLTALQKDRAANRTPSQKFWDRFVGVERAMKLSSDVVLAKLSTAAVVREAGLTPAEELIGGGIGKVLPGLAKRAPREGGLSLSAEIKAKSEMFTQGMKDAWQNLKMKQSDLDTLYSQRKPPPPSEFYDYLGYLHGAMKAPVKRAEFARSLTKRMKWAVENGQDLNNVNTMRALSEEAYVDANRSIFMQDNVVASTFTGALRMAEQSKKSPNLGPAVARIGRFLIPIVKIPTNIVGEVATGIHGVPVGGARAAIAYLKGIDSLPPAQADSIMRQLKKGSIGGALILTGYYTADHIGGFYHDKDKRTKEDVQPGRYRIGSVDLPASAGHSTGAMLLNIGATVKRVQDEQIKKSEPTKKGLGQGVLAAGSGLAHEIPFVPAATGITEAIGSKDGFQRYINSMIQSTTVPALSSHIAKILDTPGSLPSNLLQESVKRKPTTPLEAFKMGIPGLRQTVPERKEKTSTVKPPKRPL